MSAPSSCPRDPLRMTTATQIGLMTSTAIQRMSRLRESGTSNTVSSTCPATLAYRQRIGFERANAALERQSAIAPVPKEQHGEADSTASDDEHLHCGDVVFDARADERCQHDHRNEIRVCLEPHRRGDGEVCRPRRLASA